MAQQKNRRNALIAALAVLVVALAVGGTIAWLTAQDALQNTFTVGNFQDADKEPKPDDDNDEDLTPSEDENLGGYLFETEWEEGAHKLTAGVAEPKNPNVGVGKGSDKAYVFIYVKNNSLTQEFQNASAAPYFQIEKQWKAVDGQTVASTADAGSYVSGLFVYTATAEQGQPAILDPTDTDVYTGELFETITMPNGVDTRLYKDNPNIEVYAFLYGADESASAGDGGTADDATAAAIGWAEKIIAGEINFNNAQA